MSESNQKKQKPRACDCCRARRIKCDGMTPCWKCVAAGLDCSYSTAKKRGPKGRQRTVIARLRTHSSSSPPSQSSYSWDQLPKEAVRELLLYYFDMLHPITPILDRDIVMGFLDVEPDAETYAFITSLSSVPLHRIGSMDSKLKLHLDLGLEQVLKNECLRARSSYNYMQNPSVHCIMIPLFLFMNCCANEDFDSGYYYLRDAITLAQIRGIDQEHKYNGSDLEKEFIDRFLFWMLYVTERGFAIQRRRPLALMKTIDLPVLDISGQGDIYDEFMLLIKVFSSVDDRFFAFWSRGDSVSVGLAAFFNDMVKMRNELDSVVPDTPKFIHDLQKVNVIITHEWLRILLWGLSSKAVSTESFPLQAASRVLSISNSVSLDYFKVHGAGMREKVFDIGYALAELVSGKQLVNFPFDPREQLLRIMHLVMLLGGSTSPQYKALMEKAYENVKDIELPLYNTFTTEIAWKGDAPSKLIELPENDVDAADQDSDPESWGQLFKLFGSQSSSPPIGLVSYDIECKW